MENQQTELLELLERSGLRLYLLLRQLTLSEEAAEQLMQELFSKLSAHKAFSNISNATTYARRTAMKLAFDWQKTQTTTICEPSSADDSAIDETISTEDLQRILQAVGSLRGQIKEAFVMRYIQQEPYSYIAEELGKTTHHVRGLCYKARAKLQNILGDKSRPSLKEPGDE